MLKALKFIGIAVVLVVVVVALFGCFAPVFGGRQSSESMQRIETSPNFGDGQFVNAAPTSVSTRSSDSETSIMDWVFQAEDKNPTEPLPSEIFHPEQLTEGKVFWLGRASESTTRKFYPVKAVRITPSVIEMDWGLVVLPKFSTMPLSPHS